MNKKNVSILIVIFVIIIGCQTKEKKQVNLKEEVKMESIKKQGELEVLLSEKANASAAKSTEEKKKAYAKGIADVKSFGVLESALKVGSKAPNFTLNNASNQPISLYDELKNGPVILTWYRGGWCPYCNITLHALQNKLPEFIKAGATLMALTPELPDKSLSTSEKNELEFTVLSDIDNKVGKEFGVVYQLNSEIASMYENGFGLSKYNGNDNSELPLAATYVIDKNGIIQYAFLDEDYKKRAEPSEIINALQKLK